MAFDTKQNLNERKFEQFSGETLNLSGCTNIYGQIEIKSSGSFLLGDGTQNNGYILVSDSGGTGTWKSNVGWSNLTTCSTVMGCGTVASGSSIICNTFYGVEAGKNVTTGYGNVAIGHSTLYCNEIGNLNVTMGACAGYSETGSSKLHIGNSSSCSLIYGEFDNKIVCVDGDLTATKMIEGSTCLGDTYVPLDSGINTISTTGYTLQLTDKGKTIELTNTGSTSIILPTGLTIGFQAIIVNIGGGDKILTAGTGITLYTKNSNIIISGEYNAATIYYRTTNQWVGFGDLS